MVDEFCKDFHSGMMKKTFENMENFRKVGAHVENEDPKFYFEFFKDKYEEN